MSRRDVLEVDYLIDAWQRAAPEQSLLERGIVVPRLYNRALVALVRWAGAGYGDCAVVGSVVGYDAAGRVQFAGLGPRFDLTPHVWVDPADIYAAFECPRCGDTSVEARVLVRVRWADVVCHRCLAGQPPSVAGRVHGVVLGQLLDSSRRLAAPPPRSIIPGQNDNSVVAGVSSPRPSWPSC